MLVASNATHFVENLNLSYEVIFKFWNNLLLLNYSKKQLLVFRGLGNPEYEGHYADTLDHK